MTDTTKQTLSGILGAVVGVIGTIALTLGLDVQAPDYITQPPAITIVVTVIVPTETPTPEPTATRPAILATAEAEVTATAMADGVNLQLPTATTEATP